MSDAPKSAWGDAALAAAILAIDPPGTGGAAVRALPGPVRDRWLALLRGLLPEGVPWRRVPLSVADSRLLGGLDLAATLQAGRPVAERGLLAEADGGVILLPMAERLTPGTAARLAAVQDSGEVVAERDGLALRSPARLGVVALDEGISVEEQPPSALLDRLAFRLDFTHVPARATGEVPDPTTEEVATARALLPEVTAGEDVLEALCGTARMLGIDSLRAPILALRVARAAAALSGRDQVIEEDASLAARLVLGPRATQLPPSEPPEEEEPPPPPPPDETPPPEDQQKPQEPDAETLQDILLAAAEAAVPEGLLDQLRIAGGPGRSRSSGKAGQQNKSPKRGRPIGSRQGELRGGTRLALVDTLRAAAPWQPLRRKENSNRIHVHRDDIRIQRFREHSETVTIFVVDASGSSALHRLAEAKGAVELLLADCYVRRDKVALIAFRGVKADLLLPPTNSLVRAKRSLAGLPGGGGTPIATALDHAALLADAVRRKGQTPLVVMLTDGRANVGRDGKGGRERAGAEALEAARALAALRVTALLVDTSPRPQEAGRLLAAAMNARYLPLPYADAAALSRAVRVNIEAA